MNNILTIKEFAFMNGLKLNTVYSYLNRGVIKARKTFGNSYYFTLNDVRKYEPIILAMRVRHRGYFTKKGGD